MPVSEAVSMGAKTSQKEPVVVENPQDDSLKFEDEDKVDELPKFDEVAAGREKESVDKAVDRDIEEVKKRQDLTEERKSEVVAELEELKRELRIAGFLDGISPDELEEVRKIEKQRAGLMDSLQVGGG